MRSAQNDAVGGNVGSELAARRRRHRSGGSGQSDLRLVADGGTDRPSDEEDTPATHDQDGEREMSDEAADEAAVTAESVLLSVDVFEEVPGEDDLRLTDAFDRAWTERIEQMRDGDRALRWLAAVNEADPADLAVEDGGERFVVTHDGEQVGVWHSEATFFAEIVAEPTLREWVPESAFERIPAAQREELSATLLMFLERCPSCDGALEFSEEGPHGTVHVSLDCTECGATIAAGSYG